MPCVPWQCPGREVRNEHPREALREYLALHRSLGFKMQDASRVGGTMTGQPTFPTLFGGLLHTTADAAASGERAYDRFLPQHVSTAAASCPTADAQSAVGAGDRGYRRTVGERFPRGIEEGASCDCEDAEPP